MKTVLFQVIQFSISMQFSSIWPIDRTLSGASTLGQSWPGSNGNEGVLHIPQSSIITGASPSDCLALYLGHLLGESYPSALMQSVYSTDPAYWETIRLFSVISRTLVEGVLLLGISVFYCPSQLGKCLIDDD